MADVSSERWGIFWGWVIGTAAGAFLFFAGLWDLHRESLTDPWIRFGIACFVPSGFFLLFATQWLAWLGRLFPAARRAGWGLVSIAIAFFCLGIPHTARAPIVVAIALLPLAAYLTYAGIRYAIEQAWGGKPAFSLVQAAERLGFPLRRGFLKTPEISGRIAGAAVRILSFEQGPTTMEAVGPGPAPRGTFAPEGASLARVVFGEQVRTGDEEFDSAVFVRGEPGETLALLDAETRRSISGAVRLGAVIEDSCVRLVLPGGGSEVDAFARTLAETAGRLVRPDSVPGALLRNATSDPHPIVRALNATRLLAQFPDAPEAASGRVAFARDPDPRVRAVPDGPATATGGLAIAEPDAAAGALSMAKTAGAVSLKRES